MWFLVCVSTFGFAAYPLCGRRAIKKFQLSDTATARIARHAFDEGRPFRDLTVRLHPKIESRIIERPALDGPYGAKGLGELCANSPIPAIANAIFDAVGVRIDSLPLTPEKVLRALLSKGTAAQHNGLDRPCERLSCRLILATELLRPPGI
jgi:hypothetical protein